MQAVILAAGKGTRLAPLTNAVPKALVDLGGGRTLLEAILEQLPEEADELVFVVGHLQEQIRERFGASWSGRPIRYAVQQPLDGTGTALHAARMMLRGTFLVVNGDDVYAAEDLERLISHPLAILVQATRERLAHTALVSGDGRFLGLESDPPPAQPHVRVCGAYVLDERFFRYPLAAIDVRGRREYSLPHTLVELAKDAPVAAVEATRWLPVGTPEELEAARRMRRKMVDE